MSWWDDYAPPQLRYPGGSATFDETAGAQQAGEVMGPGQLIPVNQPPPGWTPPTGPSPGPQYDGSGIMGGLPPATPTGSSGTATGTKFGSGSPVINNPLPPFDPSKGVDRATYDRYVNAGFDPYKMYAGGTPFFDESGGGYNTGGGGTATSGQDPRAFLQSLAVGGKLTPQQLAAAAPQLQAMGVRILGPNSEGLQSKIQLPNGQIIDLIKDAGGQNGFQWLTAGGGSGGGGSMGGGMTLGALGAGGLPEGYWTDQRTGGGQYPLAAAGGPGLAQPWLTPFQSPGDFHPPNLTDDPGFQFRLQEGAKALERSAAAKGTLLTGGTLKDLDQFSQGLASQEYANAYGRALGQNELAYNRKLGEYGLAYDIYNNNNNNLYNRLSNLAGLGQTASGQLGQYASNYGTNAGNLITGAGNAQAAGTIGGANAWAGALGNLANQAPMWWQMSQQQQQQPPPWMLGSQQTSAYPGTYYPAGSFNV